MIRNRAERPKLAIVDYGLGNQRSLQSSCRQLGYRAIISNEPAILDQSNLLLLPGVGAFPAAMQNLNRLNLVEYLQWASNQKKGIIGICLGMQLLTERSSELEETQGIGLIPGEIKGITQEEWHIGWNNIEAKPRHSFLEKCDGAVMYFNHSFCYKGPEEYIAAVSRITPRGEPIVAAIKREHLVGLQFHPEKSQQNGLRLLDIAIKAVI